MSRNLLFACGDSTTAGSYCAGDWPNKLALLLGPQYTAVNVGVAGYTASQIATLIGGYSNQAGYNRRTLLVLGGVNDIGGGSTDSTVYSALSTAINAVSSAGWESIIWLRITPWKNSTLYTWNSTKQGYCDSLWASIQAYTVPGGATQANFHAFDTFPSLQDGTTAFQLSGTPDYHTSSLSGAHNDYTHPNDAGGLALATAIYNAKIVA